jgi:hypothetical protein
VQYKSRIGNTERESDKEGGRERERERERRERLLFPHRIDATAEAGSKASLLIDVGGCCMTRQRR